MKENNNLKNEIKKLKKELENTNKKYNKKKYFLLVLKGTKKIKIMNVKKIIIKLLKLKIKIKKKKMKKI